MRKFSFFLLAISLSIISYSQEILTGVRSNSVAPGSELVRLSKYSDIPDYIKFRITQEITEEQVISYLRNHFNMNSSLSFKLLNRTPDKVGFTHLRYQQTFNGIPLQGTMYNVHVKEGKVVSMNGMIFSSITSSAASVSESDALQHALNYVNASVYRWQVPGEDAKWYPHGELTYAPVSGKYAANNYRLTYRFDIYAADPLSRQYVFVDAQNGEIIFTLNRIMDNNPVEGTAHTVYSGSRNIIADGEAANKFYLRDSLRGDGVITLNLHQGTNYAAADNFQDSNNDWNNVNANLDQYATDAHFGMEKTYDFYDSTYNRNSIDGNGFQLVGYVHYYNNYFNAFWDGQEMTFGDGDAGYGVTPLVTLDITGHEITHGLTEFTCNLDYYNESGGLNESFSDLAGEMVERLGQGNNDWMVGEEIGYTLRWFQDPTIDGYSAASVGDFYWNNNNDPHYWSGPQNHWFYMLSEGDAGTNDLGDNYSVTGIGIDDAHAIAFRSQTIYLVPSSDYSDARFYALQSAVDLFGACSQQEISCADAWYAVGVGNEFDATVIADFSASPTDLCSLNNPVVFSNQSTNGQSFHWYFGDGTTSNAVSPSHLYTAEGTYSVKLVTDGGTCGADSIEQANLITIALPVDPVASGTSTCQYSPAILTGTANGTITWYDVQSGGSPLGTGSPFITAPLNASTTFYAENDEISAVQSAEPTDNNFGSGSYFMYTNPHYCIFDAYTDFTLKTVTVYSGQAAARTIELLDNNGNLLNSSTQNIANGTHTITLNFDIPAGTGYALGLQDGSTSNLYRNESGASFPYTLAGVLSITGNDIPDQDHYYYFYDWQVQGESCTSSRIPVPVNVLPTPTASFTYTGNGTQIIFTNATVGATSFQWNFGDGSTSTQPDPEHTYSGFGNYTVELIACDGNCCDTIEQIISVVSGIGNVNENGTISVSPNPFADDLLLTYTGNHSGEVSMKLTDVIGQVIISEQKKFTAMNETLKIDGSQLPAGIYFIRVEQNGAVSSFRVVK